MTTAQLAIQVSMSVLEPLPIGEERSRVPYEWSINGFSLNMASFQSMLDTPDAPGRLCRKMLWLSRYPMSTFSSCFHFFARWHFSCCSSVSSASESVAIVAALFHSFFSFFFFLFLLALPCSDSSPQSLLGEPVHCLLMGARGWCPA